LEVLNIMEANPMRKVQVIDKNLHVSKIFGEGDICYVK